MMEANNNQLFKAIEDGNSAVVEILIAEGVDIECRNDYHNTPLHEAAYHNQVAIAEFLVKKGAKLSVQCHENQAPLLIAAIRGYYSMVELLLAKGANTECHDLAGQTPLHIACAFNAGPLVALLLQYGANKEARDSYGYTPLHQAVQNNALEAMLLLIKQGANIEAKDGYERTPLHEAASYNASGCIHRLVVLGANIEAKDNKQRTPLHLAYREGAEEAICALEKRGANSKVKDIDGDTPEVVGKKHSGYQQSIEKAIKENRKKRMMKYAALANSEIAKVEKDNKMLDKNNNNSEIGKENDKAVLSASAQNYLIEQAEKVINPNHTISLIFTSLERAKQLQHQLAVAGIGNVGMPGEPRKIEVLIKNSNNNNRLEQYVIHVTHDEYNTLLGENAFEELVSATQARPPASYSMR